MNASENKEQTGFMTKLATFIVDKRNLVFLLMGIMLVFSLFSKNWVVVENKLTAYLPSTSETRKGLDVMEDQFTTFGSAKIMFANVSYARAQEIAADIASFEGVQGVSFDNTTDHYNNVSALYDVTFDYPEDDGRCLEGLNAIHLGHGNVHKYEVGINFLVLLDSLSSVLCFSRNIVAVLAEDIFDHHPHECSIITDQDILCHN